jgi:hypothetical protein
MHTKNLIIVGVAAACFGAVAYAAAPARRPAAAPVSRAVTLRSQYNPFVLQRVAPVSQARATVQQRVAVAAVRPPYRPETRSPYQPPTRGPYLP